MNIIRTLYCSRFVDDFSIVGGGRRDFIRQHIEIVSVGSLETFPFTVIFL